MSLTSRVGLGTAALLLGGWLCADATEGVSSSAVATPALASVQSANELTPMAVARAQRWGLSPSEWQRYETLMTGIRGSVSPSSLSPIEVLGIHAHTDAERRQYAELWARLMHEDVERVLAFQRAYDEALRRLYGNEPLISSAAMPRPTQAALAKSDRLLLFVSRECPACDGAVKDVLRLQPQVAGIDIYLVGVKPDAPRAVQDWAANHGIPAALVKAGQVTLNFEGDALARLGQSMATLPLVMRRHEEDVTVLDLATLP